VHYSKVEEGIEHFGVSVNKYSAVPLILTPTSCYKHTEQIKDIVVLKNTRSKEGRRERRHTEVLKTFR
jgi:hypothetical protein